MSQPTNTTSANQQTSPSTSANPAGILGHRTFGSSTKNASNSFYNVFGKPSTDSPDISTTTSALTIQEHRPKYAQPDKFDRDPRNYQKWKEDCSLYMLAHNNNFPDEHTAIMFMLYHMNKKALVWRTEFMAAHTVSGQGIHLGTMDNFLAALDSAFQPFDMEEDALRQLHALKQLSRPVDEYVSEFRVFATRAGLTDISQLIHLFRQGLDPDIAIQAIRRGPDNNLQAWIEAAKQGEEIICMERIYLGGKQAKRPNRILAKEKHYTNLNWLRPHDDYKDPNAMDVDNIQAILENYKNTLQDQEDSDDEQETTNQHI